MSTPRRQHETGSALYGDETRSAIANFPVSGLPMPRGFIRALGWIKASAADANRELGVIDPEVAGAIALAAEAVARGEHDREFPVDVFQTGSGTSSNMNANEVVASLASRGLGREVHPNDDVNCSQSSNDVIPTAIHVSAATEYGQGLRPAIEETAGVVDARARELDAVAKTGRTHLMDAVPLTMGQALGAWSTLLRADVGRLDAAAEGLRGLAQGGTAVGTGLNCPAGFRERFCRALSARAGLEFGPADDTFAALSSPDRAAAMSAALEVLAGNVTKIVNDLRWMASGPLAGLGEITLPETQKGSSIMPGKVNPVIAESAAMVCAQVAGNHTTIAIAHRSGNFELNVMLPVIAYNLLQSIELLSRVLPLLAHQAIARFTVNTETIDLALARNPMLVTALNRRIGYDRGAAIARRAYRERRPVLDVAVEDTGLSREELAALLDPLALTRGN